MLGAVALDHLAATLRASRGVAGKRDIAAVAARLGISSGSTVPHWLPGEAHRPQIEAEGLSLLG
jgi:hypothetical protein